MLLLKALRYKAPPQKKKNESKKDTLYVHHHSKPRSSLCIMLAAFLGNVTCKYIYIQVK